ncbi:hypothetical protein J1N51_04180 [Psychrosphaera ytuae]|uniref:Uncharacterized protein n=1 Tax=Psychrosphaera ytuae TaxID=2820710 RepID=A0A975DFG9_9GAMM|nr:hypothetical protein [Psychrosphaera ytuae]QTH64675.1 hypothetical protein J1N51_04180 [Psychrosphaera ytuae]
MKVFKFSSVLAALIIAGCGGSDDDPVADTPDPQPEPVQTSVSGKAAKGTIANGVLKIYKYVDGVATEVSSDEIVESQVTSDAQGNYTFTLIDYEGPVKVEVGVSSDASAATTMVCDAPSGCGDVAFGGVIDLTASSPNFSLASVTNIESGQAAKVNVTPLTHIATALVEASGTVSADMIASKKSKVANTFGIQGDISALDPTPLESNQDVASEDNGEELRYGLINSGLAQALYSGGGDISEKLAAATEDLVENDGNMLAEDDGDDQFEFNLSAVLNGAADAAVVVATNLQNDSTITNGTEVAGELEQMETELENEAEYRVVLAGEDGRTNSEEEETTEGDAVELAKAMVDDVRVFKNLFDEDHASNAAITAQGDEFVALIEDAGDMIELEEDNFTLLAQVSDAMTEITMADNGTTTQFDLANYVTVEGVTGTILYDEENYLFSVQATTTSQQSLNIDAALSLAEDGESVTFSLEGTMESANAKFAIKEGSGIVVNLSESVTEEQLESGDTDVEITAGSLMLDVELNQKATSTVINPVTFNGKLSAELVMVDVPVLNWTHVDFDSWLDRQLGYFPLYERDVEQMPIPDKIMLSGTFSSLEGAELSATLTLDVKEPGAYEPVGLDTDTGALLEDAVRFVSVSDDGNVASYRDNIDFVDDEDFESTVYTYTDLTDGAEEKHRVLRRDTSYKGEWFYTGFYEFKYGKEQQTDGTSIDVAVNRQVLFSSNVVIVNTTTVTAVDSNGDGVTDFYSFMDQNMVNQLETPAEFSLESAFDENGNIAIYTELVSTNEFNYDVSADKSFKEFLEFWFNGYQVNISSALDAIAYSARNDEHYANYYLSGKGLVRENSDDYLALVTGADDQPIRGVLVQPRIDNAMTFTIAEDDSSFNIDLLQQANFNVTTAVEDDLSLDYDLNFNSSLYSLTMTVDSEVEASTTEGMPNTFEYKVTMMHEFEGNYEPQHMASILRFEPVDYDQDGVYEWEAHVTRGERFNENGEIEAHDGGIVYEGIEDYEYLVHTFKIEYGIQLIPSVKADNMATGVAKRMVEQSYLSFNRGLEDRYSYTTYMQMFEWAQYDGYGRVSQFELALEADKHLDFEAGFSGSYYAHLVEPENLEGLENEETYLDVSASLAVGLTLQDYEVDLMLSANRTELDDGKFELRVNYKTPDAEAQRSFRVFVNSTTSDTFYAANAEGVVLSVTEPEEEPTGDEEVIIGEIKVGANAVLAAEVVKRGDAIFIKYKDEDGTVETL